MEDLGFVTVRVKKDLTGFYGGSIRHAGDVFTIPASMKLGKWMEAVTPKEAAPEVRLQTPEEKQAAARKEHAQTLAQVNGPINPAFGPPKEAVAVAVAPEEEKL